MINHQVTFRKHITTKESLYCIISALLIGVVYFISLRILYPIPSYYADSFTWLGAARTGQPVSFRPVGYSKLIVFFKLFSTSDIALIAGQFFGNLLVNLFLFFTCTYLFRLKKGFKILLYVLLFVNPFYLFYSNYISSDPFFNCFTVFWFTLLIWILYKPTWLLIILQLIVLASLFQLRYNAIYFPAISTLAVLLSKASVGKKLTCIVMSFIIIAASMIIMS